MVTVYTESCRSRVGYHPTIVPTCAQIYWLVWQSGLWQYPRRWLAYAGIAGVPAVYGLYALPLALIAYAVFGSSRTLGLGPDSALAMLSAATVGGLATQGSEEFLALSIALALMVGVLFIIFGLLRLGWVANFLANPVLKGFMQGLALVVLVG